MVQKPPLLTNPVPMMFMALMQTAVAMLMAWAAANLADVPLISHDIELIRREQELTRQKLDAINGNRFTQRDGDKLDKRITHLERQTRESRQ